MKYTRLNLIMYIKIVHVGISYVYGTKPTGDLIKSFMYIPTANMNRDDLQRFWDNIDLSTNLSDLFALLDNIEAVGGGFPFFYPGRYRGVSDYANYTNYSDIIKFVPYSAPINGTFENNAYIYYMTENREGWLNCTTSDGLHWGRASTVGTTFGMDQLGIYSYGSKSPTPCFAGAMFITSDNYVGVLRIYLNRNNSHLAFFNQQQSNDIINWINTLPDLLLDPYAEGGISDTGGGTGDFDGTSDPIDFPNLPTISAVDTGFISLFNPTLAELRNLASYMWNGSLFDISTFQKLFADPMNAILGLSVVPVSIPNGGQSAIKVGNIATPINMNKAATQYIEVDCGTLNVNEFWGAYLDYAPYTKAEIYLPYCGTHAIDTDDVMSKSVHVKYHVDILSGACCAYVKCGDSVLYQFSGQCSSSIPISGTDFTQMVNGVLSAAVSIGSMVATGGASAPLAIPALANTAVNGMKPSIEKSGAISGTSGMLAIQKPYIILTRPKQALPANQNMYTGYPSYITVTLSDINGYTEVESIHLEGVSGTNSELDEIVVLLKSGVIL